MRAYLALALIPVLAACGSATSPDAVLDTVRMTQDAQNQALAAKDLRGVMRVYADDATLLAAGSAPASGVTLITGRIQQRIADPQFKAEVKQGRGWASADGALAVTTATGSITSTDPATGKPVTRAVDYQTVWRKPDGAPWQIVSNLEIPQRVAEVAVR